MSSGDGDTAAKVGPRGTSPARGVRARGVAAAAIAGFAARNLRSRPSRTLLAIVGLSVPILGAIGMLGLSDGLRGLIDDTLGQVQGILVLRKNAPVDLFSELPAAMAGQLGRVPGVRVVAPQVWKLAPTIEGRRTAPRRRDRDSGQAWRHPILDLLKAVQIEGLDIPAHARLRHEVHRDRLLPGARGGRFLDDRDRGTTNVVISSTIAREYAHEDGRPRVVADSLRMAGEDFTIVGIYETGSVILDGTILMDIATARRITNTGDETVSCFHVEPADRSRTAEVASRIKAMIRGVDARTTADFRVGVGRMLSKLDRLLLILIGLALAVGSIGVLNTMLMSTSERLAEFGILRANGWSRGNVLSLVLAESLCLGLVAGLIGCSLAAAGFAIAGPFLEGGFRLVTSPAHLALGLGLSLILSGLGGLYPAWHASRLAPMETIRIGAR
ncbi:ABC transporter permease [Aquisphaera insulae]|uniref:ABC transporter permease n=1 Tax=Aquisphaera insulae TaxID=2712864 RepID=UPI0013ED92C4|nr:ABC transporter permease [Aquisphaera insulae]